MRYKIVSDSSSNLFSIDAVPYANVPLKIIAGDREFVDTPDLDLAEMIEFLKSFKSKSGSSCPNVQEWLDAFEDADCVFCVTITKNLSGSYNAAKQAIDQYLEAHPDRKACIFDSLSAGPELAMIIDKTRELILEGKDFETIRDTVLDYHNHLHTIFGLESLTNLARNGRVNPAVAKIAGVLDIRIVGEAVGGQIVPVKKPRGEKKTRTALLEVMEGRGLYDGSLVRISHCYAEDHARTLQRMILEKFPNCRFIIEPTTALCSFYAEVGGVIIGYEGDYNTYNNNKDF